MNKDQQLPHDLAHRLRLLEVLDRITQVSLARENMEDVLSGVLDMVLEVFNADRAWFLYPCDPGAPSWGVPMERTHPEWPGLCALGEDIPTNRDVSEIFSELLRANGTIQYGPHTDHPIPQFAVEQFSVKSQLHIALRPKIGKAWVFGLHHCASEVIHDEEDLHLFSAIAHRISDTLSVLISNRQLNESEVRYHSVVSALSEGIVSQGRDRAILTWNPAAERILGLTGDQIQGLRGFDPNCQAIHEDGTPFPVDTHPGSEVLQTGVPQSNVIMGIQKPDGTLTWISINAVPIFDHGDPSPSAVVVSFSDITERKQAEQQLHIAATAFETQEGILVTDTNGLILRVNCAFTNITGYTAAEVIGKSPNILLSDRHDANFYASMWESIHSTGGWNGEIWNRRKNGEIYPERFIINAVKNSNGTITNYVATLADITMSREAADEIKNLAFYDPLTRLPNRRLLLDRLARSLASSARSDRKGALLFIDLDNFKILNDTLGHDIGDLLLQHVAQRLETCVREGDTIARLGGDEFVVILEDLSEHLLEAAAQTESIGEKILATLNQPYLLATYEYRSTSSIGAALFGGHERGVDDLFKQADIAMYQAKKAGRNTLRFFDPQMQDTINARAALENELRKAIENRQFHLYYQIQLDSSYRPLGAEALIRWAHPERGLVFPEQFIALAEETGLILPIGQWVVETACAQIKAWQQDALTRNLVLAVNVSARQFHQPDFVAQVQAAVQRHAINPRLLKMELTESMLLDNIEATIATMNALKDIGVEFSLDDFGSGYSSLQYLKRLPLFQLKIDRSFVRDIATDNSDRTIVRTIIAMAQSLGFDVIAEGVETQEQRQLLLGKGCTHYQGYLFGKPVQIEQFEALLKQV